MTKKIRFFVLSASSVFFLTSCSSMKAKVGDVGSDPNISATELNFKPEGSDAGFKGLTTVNFQFDRADLTDRGRQILEENAQWIQNNPRYIVEIEGHCDKRGSVQYNIALGEKRANRVREYLINLGIPRERMSVISYGKEKLIALGDDESSHYKNRRANFKPIRR